MPRKPTPDIMTDILAGQPAGALAPGSMTGAVHDIDLIDDNPWQPRQTYDATALEELAGSIERNGLQQIPAARRTPDGRVQLKFGHRRKRAYDLLRAKDSERPAGYRALCVPYENRKLVDRLTIIY